MYRGSTPTRKGERIERRVEASNRYKEAELYTKPPFLILYTKPASFPSRRR